MTDEEIMRLADGRYSHIKRFASGEIAVIGDFIFTTAILAGVNRWGYEERWCYGDRGAAIAALAAWDGEGEPAGWHRHPASGRRRDKNGVETVRM